MNRLSGLDALFLYLETPLTPMHVGSVTTFAPPPGDIDLFAALRRHTADRLDLLPSYKRRLAPTPFGLDHPSWIVEDEVDLDYHLRHVALPKPGTMAQLRELVARLHAQPLDRTKPLWEYYLIEGLSDGGFAVYAKVHHSSMDGVAGGATLQVMYDFSPNPEASPRKPTLVRTPRETADTLELTGSALVDLARHGVRAVKSLPALVKGLVNAAPSLSRDARYLFSYLKGMPRTPLNVSISGERILATSSLPLAEVKALAKSRGATINDIVMALSAGALRRYLQKHGALPDVPLAAGVPVSLRQIGDSTLNNQVVFSMSRLPTQIAAPLPRLAAARAAGQEAKTLFADVRDLLSTDIAIPLAPLIASGLAKLWASTGAADVLPWSFNVVISNVPGPRSPMYCAGAAATHYFPLSIAYHGCALNITVQSYLDTLDFGLIACRRTVPDAQSIADDIVEDFRAMRLADLALASPDAVALIDIDKPRRLLSHQPEPEAPAKAAKPRRRATPRVKPANDDKPARAPRRRRAEP